MKKHAFRGIVILMTIAMAGLIVFQWYWVRNAMALNRERFKQDVHSALNAVAEKLENQEALYIAEQKLAPGLLSWRTTLEDTAAAYENYKEFVLGQFDSLRIEFKNLYEAPLYELSMEEEPARPAPSQRRQPHNIFDVHNQIDSILAQQFRQRGGFFDFRPIDSLILRELNAFRRSPFPAGNELHSFFGQRRQPPSERDYAQKISDLNRKIDSVRRRRYEVIEKRLQQKSKMLALTLDELFQPPVKIEKRINPADLDSLIRQELLNKGVDLDFEYSVVDKSSDQIAFATAGAKDLGAAEFQVNLFPGDIIGSRNFLNVYFPGQQQYLMGKILVSSLSSAILAALIVFCFAYAIFTILKQKKLSEMKNDFINNMTHEFKTPIATVSLACEALQDSEIRKDEKFVSRYLGVIRDENKRLGGQVEKVLQTATLEKRDFKLKYEKVNAHKLIQKAAAHIRLIVDSRGGTLTTALNAKSPELVADQVHLTNIVSNLLDNAVKYSAEPPAITIATRNAGEGLIISVADKGIGMTREVARKIFDKFYRAPTGNLHDVKGFGLGLTYVKTMTEAFGGRIDVKTAPGKGSVFEIYLPFGDDGKI